MRLLYLLLISVFCATVLPAQWTLRGHIQDTYSEKNLKGVTITSIHEGKQVSAVTNKKGKFKIKVQDSTNVVTFEKEGYYPETIVINNAKKVQVGLTKKRDTKEADVYEDSYGSLSMDRVTSAVTVLKTQDFNQAVALDVYEMLRGRVPGLMIKRDAQSPNSEPLVMLRSAANVTNVIEPLIIVDGNSNFSLSNVDPNDVKSIQVLRDGSATAMYGSQAIGGVIIITTKQQ